MKKKNKVKKKKQLKVILKQNFSENSISGISAASPKARKFARELGVNINEINGSQRQGRVVENDVKNFISSKLIKFRYIKKSKIN